MIKQEKIIVNGKELIKTYSDSNKYIIQNETGAKYIEAVDIPYKYTYIESEEEIPKEPIAEEVENAGELRTLFGFACRDCRQLEYKTRRSVRGLYPRRSRTLSENS